MNKLYFFAAACFLFISGNVQAITYNWNTLVAGNLTYTNGNMSAAVTNTAFDNRAPRDPNGGAGGGYNSPKYVSAATIATYQGGTTNDYGMPGLVLGVNWTNLTSSTTLTITFAVPVSGPVSFNIYDINTNSALGFDPVFIDQITLTGTDCAGNTVYPAITGCANTVSGANNNIITGKTSCTNTTNTITYNSTSLKTIVLTYASGSPLAAGYGTDPDPQYIIVSEITAASGSLVSITTAAPAINCTNSTPALSATSTLVGGSYTWAGPNSSSPAGTAPNSSSTNVSATGTYTVTVSAGGNCSATASVSVTQNVSAPTVFINPVVPLGCSVSSVTLTANGSPGTVTYAWGGGGTGSTKTVSTAGTYQVTVTNPVNGCTAVDSITVINSAPLTINVTGTPSPCGTSNGGIAFANIVTGTGPFFYSWSSGSNTSGAFNLNPGTWRVTVTTGNGCSATGSITLNASTGVTITTSSTNTTCGFSSGTATVNVTTGTSPYTYTWSNGETVSSIGSLAAGTYTVTVNDNGGCSASASRAVGLTGSLTVTKSATPATCGTAVGTATINVSGPPGPLTYVWNNGGNTSTISNLNGGTYHVTVTTTGNCSASASVTVTSTPAVTLSMSRVHTSCGKTNGIAIVSTTTGTAPFTYNWGISVNNDSITNLAAGNYTVSVTDNNTCSASASVTVNASTGPALSFTKTNETCGNNNGSITANVTGTNGQITYAWGNTANTATISGLTGGQYKLTVTDANNCTAIDSATITATAAVVVSAASANTTCGNNNGKVRTNITSGTAPYAYTWSISGTVDSIVNLSTGNYLVTVSDANSCSATASATVSATVVPSLSMAKVNATCGGSNGSATANVSNAAGLVVYNWSNTGNTATISNIAAGTYKVTATDANNCVLTDSTVITATIGVALTTLSVNNTCGNNNGRAYVSTTSGTAPFTYTWGIGGSNDSIINLTGGNYPVTVSDANSCSASIVATVNSIGGPVLSVLHTNATCGNSNGSASVNVTGATGQVAYTWNNGGNGTSISGIPAGSYAVTVVDGNNCAATDSVVVTTITAVTLSTSSANTTCGNNNGKARVNVSTGTSPYIYTWGNNTYTDSLTNLAPGNYLITVSDANTCSATSTVTVSATAVPTLFISATHATCGNSNGIATANVSNAAGQVNYTWSNGGTNSSISNIAANKYHLTISDANNCSVVDSINITSTVAVIFATSTVNKTCGINNGKVRVSITSGTGPYTYNWNVSGNADSIINLNAGSYTVTVSDINSCSASASVTVNSIAAPTMSLAPVNATCGNSNGSAIATVSGAAGQVTYTWSNGGNASLLPNIAAGNYRISAVDGNNCLLVDSVIITSTPAVLLTTSTINNTCGNNNGKAYINTTNGTAPFVYTWGNGGNTDSLLNLVGGNYPVTVSDGNNCSASAIATVSSTGGPTLAVTAINATCGGNNGSATVNVTTSTGQIVYIWSNGGNAAINANIPGGLYGITVVDGNNCAASDSISVATTAPVLLTTSSVDNTCGNNNGSARVNITSGTAPFVYTWNTGATIDSLVNLGGGSYTVTVSDANSCSASINSTVNSIGGPTPALVATDATCGTNNGNATATVTGGTGQITYTWSNGNNTSALANIGAGVYRVTIVDANSCAATDSVEVISLSGAVSLSASSLSTSCGKSNGSASVSVTSGTAPFTFLWNNSADSASLPNLPAGTYTVVVSDSNGCSATATAIVGPSSNNTVNLNADKTIMCPGDSAQICAPAGKANYIWNTGETSACIRTALAGNYYITVTDTTGCSATSTVSIAVRPLPPVSITVNGDTLKAFNAVTYQWYLNNTLIPNATSSTYIAQVSGLYTLLVTDTNGCTALSNGTNIIKVGIDEPLLNKIKVYPNPLENGRWSITVNEQQLGSNIEIFDDNGRLVYLNIIKTPQSEIELDAPSGIYLLRLTTGNSPVNLKLVKF